LRLSKCDCPDFSALLKSFEVMMGAYAPIPLIVMNGRHRLDEPDGSSRFRGSDEPLNPRRAKSKAETFSRQSPLMRRLTPRGGFGFFL